VRVAALYDIHGNVAALEAVLGELDHEDTILLGGDIVGGPGSRELLERLRALGGRARWIRGNLERQLTDRPAPTPGGAPPEVFDEITAALSDEQLRFLYGLPERDVLEVDGLGEVLFVHATPQNDMDIVTAISTDERFAANFGGSGHGVAVCGHTHQQFDRTVDGVRVVNAGSVGMPYEDEPGAYWALLGPEVELRRTSYPGAEPSEIGRREASEYFESLIGG
jgi:predicted phosphodiesterase